MHPGFAGRVNSLVEPILVTGGSGFIGQRLVSRLSEQGCEVLAPSSRDMDLRRWEECERFFSAHRPRTVFHLAATARGRQGDTELLETFEINTTGTVHLLEACRRFNVERVIVTGTGDEMGLSPAQVREGFRPAPEPKSIYAASKAAATLFCEAICRFSELRPTVLRLFAVYGPGQSLDFLLPSLLEALRSGQPLSMTGGEQRRDFIWLDDVVDVLLAVAAEGSCKGRTLDVCTGQSCSLKELVELLSSLSGRPVPVTFGAMAYRPGELFAIAGDPQPLESLVGPLLATTLEAGLRQLLAQNSLLK